MAEDEQVEGDSSSISDVWSKLLADAASPGFSLRTHVSDQSRWRRSHARTLGRGH